MSQGWGSLRGMTSLTAPSRPIRPPAPGTPALRAMHRPAGVRLPDLERHLPKHFSVSALNAYLRCGRQWMYERVYRLPSVPHVHATAGTHAHRVLELLMQKDPQDRTLDESLAIHAALVDKLQDGLEELEAIEDPGDRLDYARAIGHADEDLRHLVELVQVQDQRDVFDARTLDALHGYFDLSKDPGAVDLVGTEHDLVVTFDTPSGPVPFRALIDRLDRLPEQFGGGVMVVDYKTGKAVDPRWDDGAYRRQILLYAAAVEAATGELPSHGLLLYVNAREAKQVKITRDEVDRTLILLGRVWKDLRSRLETDDHRPGPSALCGWCPMVDVCPEGEKEVRQRAERGSVPGGLRADAPARALLDLEP